MFILLSGRPPLEPFDGQTDDEILENVSKGVYKITGPVWKNVSKEGIELVKRMLKFDADQRITAQEALNNTWFKQQLS